MQIQAIKGMIMDVAPSLSEAIAVWIYNSWNARIGIWRYEIKKNNYEIELEHPKDRHISPRYLNSAYDFDLHYEPYRLHHETLWKISNNESNLLKYIYIFPNPKNKYRLDTLQDIDIYVCKCLDTMLDYNIKSVSFLLIPSLSVESVDEQNQNDKSAHQMIQSISKWLSEHKSDMRIFLVDRLNGFKSILEAYK